MLLNNDSVGPLQSRGCFAGDGQGNMPGQEGVSTRGWPHQINLFFPFQTNSSKINST